GLLLGLCLWPFAHELGLWLRAWGGGVPEEVLKESEKLLASWRELSPVLVVLALGLVPAVVEELFFRGCLSRGLVGLAGPLGGVLASSLLFALFQLWMPGALAAERFVVSLLLGLVLGWVAWRTGSVLPGVLMHGAHNGTLALLAYYEPALA